MTKFQLRFPKEQLGHWLAQYPADGDAKMLEIGKQARKAGYYTWEQFKRVCDWKTRRRPHKHYEKNTPEQVAVQTYKALNIHDERERIDALIALTGVRLPTASMLLQLAYPEEYPVIDVRALWSLGYESKSVDVELWLDYVAFCRELGKQCNLSLRDLDRALFEYSKAHQPDHAVTQNDAEE